MLECSTVSYDTHSQETEEMKSEVQLTLFFFPPFSLLLSTADVMNVCSGWFFFSHINFSENILIETSRGVFSSVILNLTKLALKSNYQSFIPC